eukprot:2921498-Prymnesium_polylepis.1
MRAEYSTKRRKGKAHPGAPPKCQEPSVAWGRVLCAPEGSGRIPTRIPSRAWSVNGRFEAIVTRRELQRHQARIVARLGEIAAHEPEATHRRGLPHVPELAEERTGVLGGARAVPPHAPDGRGDALRDDVPHKVVHRAVARRVDEQVRLEVLARVEHDRTSL